FGCDIAAYNTSTVYLFHREMDGITPLAFPTPVIEAEHENPEDRDSPVRSVKILTWTANTRLTNASFDPETGEINSFALWRGLGDAFDASTWVIQNGGAQILHYEVDASYDEKAEPQLVVDFP